MNSVAGRVYFSLKEIRQQLEGCFMDEYLIGLA